MIPYKTFHETYITRRIDNKQYADALEIIHGYSLACDLTDMTERRYAREANEASQKIHIMRMAQIADRRTQ